MNKIWAAYIIMLLNFTSGDNGDDNANCLDECGGGLNNPVNEMYPRFNGNILQS